MTDPFKEFGGREITTEESKDPFAEFGGAELQTETDDPFAEFGGTAIPETPKEETSFIPSVTEEELKSIASKHGMKNQWEDLAEWVPYFWANVEGRKSTLGQDIIGAANEIILGSLGTKAASFLTGDEKKYKALADLKELLESRESGLRTGTEIAGAAVATAGTAGLAARGASQLGRVGRAVSGYISPTTISGGATAGAISGAGQSIAVAGADEELEAALYGGAFGAALGGIAGAIGKSFKKAGEQAEAAKKLREELGPEAANLETKAVEILNEQAEEFAAKNSRAIESAKNIEEVEVARLNLGGSLSKESKNTIRKLKAEDYSTGKWQEKLNNLPAGEQVKVREYFRSIEDQERIRELARWIKGRKLGLDEAVDKNIVKKAKRGARISEETKPSKDFTDTKKASKVVSKWLDSVDEAGRQAVLDGFNKAKAANMAIEDLGLQKISGEGAALLSDFTKVIDGKYAFRIFDDVLGTNSEVLQDTLVHNRRKFTENVGAFGILKDKQLKPLVRKLLPTDDDAKQFFKTYEEGGLSAFDGEMKELATRWENFMKLAADRAKSEGLEFGITKNYVPHMTVDLPTTIGRITAKMDALMKETGIKSLTGDTEALKALRGRSDFQELMEGLEYVTGKNLTGEKLKTKDLQNNLQAALGVFTNKVDLRDAFVSKSGFAMQRKGKVPEFLREYNPLQLTDAWTNSMFKHAAQRAPLEQLQVYKNIATNRGVPEAAAYYDRLIKDLVGRRGNTLSTRIDDVLDRIEASFVNKAETAKMAGNRRLASFYEGLSIIPRTVPAMTQVIYPGVLGLNPRALLVNATQIPTMLVPEVGTAYGAKLYLRAIPRLLGLEGAAGLSKLKRGSDAPLSSLERLRRSTDKGGVDLGADDIFKSLKQSAEGDAGGIFSRDFLDNVLEGEGMQARRYYNDVKDNLLKTPKDLGRFMDTSAKGMEKLGNGMMYFFEMTEKVNRATSLSFARDVADDLLKGSSDALKILKSPRMGSGYKRAITEALEKKNEGEVFRLVKEYFQSTAVLNYDRASLSEAARYLGPIFSTFTKWPLTISGDIYQQILRTADVPTRRLIEANMKKYVVPFIGMIMFDRMARTWLEDNVGEQAANSVLGRDSMLGIASSAPVMSPAAILTGENLFLPPLVGNTAGVVSGILSMKPTTAVSSMDRLAQTVLPPYALMGAYTKMGASIMSDEEIPTIGEGIYGLFTEGASPRDIAKGARKARRKLERYNRKIQKRLKKLNRMID